MIQEVNAPPGQTPSATNPNQQQVSQQSPQPQVNQQIPQPDKSKSELLQSIRTKLLKNSKTIDFEVSGVKYTCDPIPRSFILDAQMLFIRKYNLKENPQYDQSKSLFEQLDIVDSNAMYALAKDIMLQVLKQIDGFTIDEIFIYEGSEYKTAKEGLDKYLDSPKTPIFDILMEFIKKINEGQEFAEDLKNS